MTDYFRTHCSNCDRLIDIKGDPLSHSYLTRGAAEGNPRMKGFRVCEGCVQNATGIPDPRPWPEDDEE